MRAGWGIVVSAGLAVAVAACGGPGPSRSGTTSGPPPASSAGTGPAAGSSSTGAGGAAAAQDLTVTAAVRTELLEAAAAAHGLPASDFTGLVPGGTYYALDTSTGALWAATGLVPGSDTQAQVSVQDDGSYTVLTRPGGSGGTWQGWEVGATGEPGGQCPVTIPAAVLAVWGWSPGSCLPPGGVPSGTPTTTGSPAASSTAQAAAP